MMFETLNFDWIYAAGIILLVLSAWSYPHLIRPFFEKKRLSKWLLQHPEWKKYLAAEILFTELYQHVNPTSVSHAERHRLLLKNDDFMYGEVEFLSFLSLLQAIKIQKDDIFYDLGCGAGKAVFIAALCFDFKKACGIELLPKLYQLASQQLKKLNDILEKDTMSFTEIKPQPMHFIEANILECDISDGTVIFINATCFNYMLWEAIIKKLKTLAAGTRILVASKKIIDPQFDMLFGERYLMSWGMNTVHAYIKTS